MGPPPPLPMNGPEFFALERVLPQLIEKQLITEIERQKIANTKHLVDRKLAFFDLIIKKEYDSAKDILRILQYVGHYVELLENDPVLPNECSEEDCPNFNDNLFDLNNFHMCSHLVGGPVNPDVYRNEREPKNPLLHNVVIKNLFEFLNLDDIKSCRTVCKEWNSVAEPLLRKRAKIVFHHLDKPSVFYKAFGRSIENLPFKAFRFVGLQTVSKLIDFCDKVGVGEHITYLHFDGVHLTNDRRGTVNVIQNILSSAIAIDVTPILERTKLSVLKITPNSSAPTLYSKLAVRIGKLITLQNLALSGCIQLYNPDDAKISPVKINLDSVIFLMNCNNTEGLEPAEYLLNNSFDFSKATKININPIPRRTRLSLNVASEIATPEYVKLKSIEVTNWETSKWSVETLELESVSINCKTTMNIRELRIINATSLDLSFLPPTVEKLHLNLCNNTGVKCSQPTNLPNLKVVEIILQESVRRLNFFSFLADCSNLSEISIKKMNKRMCILDLNWIPRSVKKIRLNNSISIVDRSGSFLQEPFQLESLILNRYNFLETNKVLKIIDTKLLVMRWNSYPYPNRSSRNTADDMAQFIEANPAVPKIVMNFSQIFNIPRVEFSKSLLADFVDKKAKHYVFENQWGKELTKEQFDVYMNI